MTTKTYVRTMAVAASAALALAVPGAAWAVPAPAAATAAAGTGLATALPTSTSWVTPTVGMTLAYPRLEPGAKPLLALTIDAGRTWSRIPAPSVPYPSDRDLPQLLFRDGVIAVSNGDQVQTSTDSGRHWSRVQLAGLPSRGRSSISDVSIDRGRLLVLVTTSRSSSQTEQVYAGSDLTARLAPVHGLSETGGEVYGEINAVGAVQVVLTADSRHLSYWYGHGSTLMKGPLPCPAVGQPFLAGVRGGSPVVLCTPGPSTTGPGSTTAQVVTAPRLGARFVAAHPAAGVPNLLDVAAASTSTIATGTAPGLRMTFDAGASYRTVVPTPEGSMWAGVAFLSHSVGVAVGSTINSQFEPVDHVYRTTDGGHHWSALHL